MTDREAPADVDAILERAGFDAERSVLTRRQGEVLALRERDVSQQEIAELLGTSRANISSVEASARRNVEKAAETVEVAAALRAPVRVQIPSGTDVYDVPELVYEACDDAGTKVAHASAELLRRIREQCDEAITAHEVVEPLTVGVSADGAITVRRSLADD